ncbi:phage tail assembly chaperone [Comamonas odontotermitis]|uniref:phage tail assembly chaperone n=1 Tax=Comamonas odontotermitis TaxID=379895 RepID=UPI001CC3743F|nr:phage tail assembly chaperone [Comamonas odontotermitis]UBB16133.1 phage tail assembly chaperone [Comamonas odontotermitis]
MTTETKKQKPAAFIFGARPESIPGTVEFTSVTGQEVKLECQFIYRTRKEFAQFWDQLAEAKVNGFEEGEKFSFAKLADQGIEANAKRTMQFVKSWPLDLELSQKNLEQLFDEEPEAPSAFWEKYRAMCTEGRLGNLKPQ